MRLTLICLVVFLLVVPGVCAGDYPRHIDIESLVTVAPDFDSLFSMYHDIFGGMILANVTLDEEFINSTMEVYGSSDLNQFLDDYGEQILEQVSYLNNTQFYLDQAIAHMGEFDFESAKSSFFSGLSALQASNQSVVILEGSTVQLGEMLGVDPELLLQDLEELGLLIDDYQAFAQVLVNFVDGEALSEEDVERLQDSLAGIIDEAYLERIGDIVDPRDLGRTQISLEVSPDSVLVGGYVQVEGRLSSLAGPLEGKILSILVGDEELFVTSGVDGVFKKLVQVLNIYENTTKVRCIYWPKGDDVSVYSPATAFKEVELVFYVPELEFEYGEALPGRGWNVSGSVTFDGRGLEGFTVNASLLGGARSSVTDESGFFVISVPVDPGARVEVVNASVLLWPNLAYSGMNASFSVQVVKMPLTLRVDVSSWTFSGGFVTVDLWVESDGVPLDGSRVRVTGEDVLTVYTVNGSSSVSLYTGLFRSSDAFPYTVSVTPSEPWIESGFVTGSFPVYSSVLGVGFIIGLGLAVYYLRFRGKPRGDSPEIEPVVQGAERLVEPVVQGVKRSVEPVVSEPDSFSWLYRSVLIFVGSITGNVVRPSDTIREYVGRIAFSLSEGVRRVFEELSLLYERWLYDRPFEVDVERVKVLVMQVKEDRDEE